MKWTYDQAMRRVFADEGGYSNDAADPGGPTKYGITIIDVRKYLNAGATASDVRALTVAQAMEIYQRHYADPIKYDALPAGVDYAVLDYAINSGLGRAGKVLRALVGWPTNSSAITSEVIAAVSKRDPVKLITAIYDERLTFLKGLKIFSTFGKGWTRRCVQGETAAVAMARQRGPSSLPPEVIPSGGKGKGIEVVSAWLNRDDPSLKFTQAMFADMRSQVACKKRWQPRQHRSTTRSSRHAECLT